MISPLINRWVQYGPKFLTGIYGSKMASYGKNDMNDSISKFLCEFILATPDPLRVPQLALESASNQRVTKNHCF